MRRWRLRRCCMMWWRIAEACRGCGRFASMFGSRVAKIVEGCTDSFVEPKPDWIERKKDYLERSEACRQRRRGWYRRRTSCITCARFWPITGNDGDEYLGSLQRQEGRNALVLSRVERRVRAHAEPHHARVGDYGWRSWKGYVVAGRCRARRGGPVPHEAISTRAHPVHKQALGDECMPRMLDLIRTSQVPSNLMQSAARGSLSVPPGEMIEILGLSDAPPQAIWPAGVVSHWRDGMRMTCLAAAQDSGTSVEVLKYWASTENLRAKLLPALVRKSVGSGTFVAGVGLEGSALGGGCADGKLADDEFSEAVEGALFQRHSAPE